MNEFDVYAHMEATRLELALGAERARHWQNAIGDAGRGKAQPGRVNIVMQLLALLARKTRAARPATDSTPPMPAADATATLACQDAATLTSANARRARAVASAMRESRRSDESLMRGPI